MPTIKAILTGIKRTGSSIEVDVDFRKLSDNSFMDTKAFTYPDPSTISGTQIVADVTAAGSVYANALSKESTLQTFLGTSIQI